MDNDNWVVEVHGPHGVKMVEFEDSIVRAVNLEEDDTPTLYATAVWLAYNQFWMDLGKPNG